MGRRAHAFKHTHACTHTETEVQRQTGSAAGAKAGKLAGARLAVSSPMIKGAKKINFQFSPQAYIRRKRKKKWKKEKGRREKHVLLLQGDVLDVPRNEATEQGK